MISNFGSSMIFNEIEYFTFINLLLISLFLFYCMLFYLILNSSLILNSMFYNDILIELFITFLSLIYVILMISPGLLLFLDFDLISSSSFMLYVTGFQWAWSYNISFNSLSSSFDQLLLSSSLFSFNDTTLNSAIFNLETGFIYYNFISSTLISSLLGNFVNFMWLWGNSWVILSAMSASGMESLYNLMTFLSSIELIDLVDWNSYFCNFDLFWGFSINCVLYDFCYSMVYNIYSGIFSGFGLAYVLNNLFGLSCIGFYEEFTASSFSLSSYWSSTYFLYFPFYSSFVSGCLNSSFSSYYMCMFNNYLILPLFSLISCYISSFDVIHSFGFHSLGMKSDAIPGRLNFVSSLFLSFTGSYLGYCYELCGLGHTSMLSSLLMLISLIGLM